MCGRQRRRNLLNIRHFISLTLNTAFLLMRHLTPLRHNTQAQSKQAMQKMAIMEHDGKLVTKTTAGTHA